MSPIHFSKMSCKLLLPLLCRPSNVVRSGTGGGGGGGGRRLNLGGCGVSNELSILSSERVRKNRVGRFGGRGGGGGSKLPVEEMLGAPYNGKCTYVSERFWLDE